jgi:hypothetical protein
VPHHPGAVILAADTTVWHAGEPPPDRQAGRSRRGRGDDHRRSLARGSHLVTTAFVLADARGPDG